MVIYMNSTENAYTDTAWTIHMIGVYRRALKNGDPCPAYRQRLITELANAQAALAAMKREAA